MSRTRVSTLCGLVVLCALGAAAAQEPPAPQTVAGARLQTAIGKLGDLDYATRTNAARTVRRTAGPQAVPALLQAVAEHTDGYVRYRALALLPAFNDPRTKDAMREALNSPNDRLRAVAYTFFEHNPDRAVVPAPLSAFEREQAEFVRPELVRALAAAARQLTDPASAGDITCVQQALVRDVARGEDFFRSAVIEALGDYKGSYAFDAIVAVTRLEGPLQDDAALALGKIGDKRALETRAGLQRTAARSAQPSIAAAICLLDVNCATHENYIVETVDALFEIGIPASDDTTRAPVALAVGAVALRNTALLMPRLEHHLNRAAAIDLLAEGERFFALARRTYWGAAEGTPTRALMQTSIGKLDF